MVLISQILILPLMALVPTTRLLPWTLPTAAGGPAVVTPVIRMLFLAPISSHGVSASTMVLPLTVCPILSFA